MMAGGIAPFHAINCKRSALMHYFDKATGFYRSLRTGRVVCKCGRGYGSEFDGKCYRCRGKITAWEAKKKLEGRK